MKGGSYEGSPRVKVQEVKGLKLCAGILSPSPVPTDPRSSGPRDPNKTPKWQCTSRAPLRETCTQEVKRSDLHAGHSSTWPVPLEPRAMGSGTLERHHSEYVHGWLYYGRPVACTPGGQEVRAVLKSLINLTRPPWPQSRGHKVPKKDHKMTMKNSHPTLSEI